LLLLVSATPFEVETSTSNNAVRADDINQHLDRS